MSAITLDTPRSTLADQLVGRRGMAIDIGLILTGTAVVSALAYVEIPMWPVPITGQTLGVVLVGAALGARRGALALTTYMILGLAGLPIFAGGTGGLLSVTKPSFGFIIGFIGAAALVGWLAERRWDRRPLLSIAAFFLAGLIPFVTGLPYMAVVLTAMGVPIDVPTVIAFGVTPFLIGGIVKWIIAAALMPVAWKIVEKVDAAKRN